jgi:hypothetical protein
MSRSQQRPPSTRGETYIFKGGKYAGHSVADVIDADPGYLLWLQKNTDMDFDHTVIDRAEEVSKTWTP